MKEPSSETLIAWLHQVLELEKRVYVIDNTIGSSNRAIEQLEIPSYFREYKLGDSGFKPVEYSAKDGIPGIILSSIPKAYVIGVVIMSAANGVSILGFIVCLFWPIIATLYFFMCNGYADPNCLACFLVVLFYALVYLYGLMSSSFKSGKQEWEMERALEKKNQEQKAQVAKYNEVRLEQANTLKSEVFELKVTKELLESLRDQLYRDGGYLHENIRGFYEVAYILDLLETGRCTTLYGPGGAIDTLAKDGQFMMIAGKLDTVIFQLGELRQSHALMLQVLNDTRNEIQNLAFDLKLYEQDAREAAHRRWEEEKVFQSKLLECERYRTQCVEYAMGQRISIPSRPGI